MSVQQEKSRRRKAVILTIGFHAAVIALAAYMHFHPNFTPTEKESEVAVVEETFIELTPDRLPPLNSELMSSGNVREGELDGVNDPAPAAKPAAIEPEPVAKPTPQILPTPANTPKAPEQVITATEETAEVNTGKPADKPSVAKAPTEGTPKPFINPAVLFPGLGGGKGNGKEEGAPLGRPAANGDKPIGGDGNDGTGNGLKMRKVLGRPSMTELLKKQGTVRVNVCVNRKGEVVSAEYTMDGSTTSDAYLINLAEGYARQYKYEANSKAPVEQCGFILFVFKTR